MTEQQSDGWAASESRDWVEGRHRRDNDHVLEHAAVVRGRNTRQHLTATRSAFERAVERGWIESDEWPARFENTQTYRERRQMAETEAVSERVENNDGFGLRHHVGSQADEVDVSGWHDIETIREQVSEKHARWYIYGEPGNGKTRSGCLMARHWLQQRREAGADNARVLTNIRTLEGEDEAVTWVSNWGDLKDLTYAEMDAVLAEQVEPFVFLFDEASSQASGGGTDGWETSLKLAVLVYKIRKFGGAVIIIGHDGKDLHPAVRELCKVLHKESKKKARFYATIKNRQGKDPLTPKISGWPDSKWSPNDKDPAPWSWSSGNDEDAEEITRESAFRELAVWTVVQAKTRNPDQPPSNATIASEHLQGLYSAEWVRRRWNEYDRGELGETVAKVQEVIA